MLILLVIFNHRYLKSNSNKASEILKTMRNPLIMGRTWMAVLNLKNFVPKYRDP